MLNERIQTKPQIKQEEKYQRILPPNPITKLWKEEKIISTNIDI